MPSELLRCSVVTCRGVCDLGFWWCTKHRSAVELHELVVCALARHASRRTRLNVVEVISRRLEKLNRQQLRAAERRIAGQRAALEAGCGHR